MYVCEDGVTWGSEKNVPQFNLSLGWILAPKDDIQKNLGSVFAPQHPTAPSIAAEMTMYAGDGFEQTWHWSSAGLWHEP